MFAPRYNARQAARVLAARTVSPGCANMPTGPRLEPASALAPEPGSAAPAGVRDW